MALWSTKAALSLKRVKTEEKLLWEASIELTFALSSPTRYGHSPPAPSPFSSPSPFLSHFVPFPPSSFRFFFPIPLPKSSEGGLGARCKLPQWAPANAFRRIYGSQNAPRGSIFQLPPTFPMTQNASSALGLDAGLVTNICVKT